MFDGYSGSGTNKSFAVSNGQTPNTDILSVGDYIVITYSGIAIPPPPHSEKIQPDGNIYPPHLKKGVKAAGLSIRELQKKLYDLYTPGIYIESLTLTINTGERFFAVDGEVNVPGRYQYLGSMTVLEGIASARGLNNYAAKKRIQVIRADGTKVKFDYDKARNNQKYNIPLYPKDMIFIPKRSL